MQERLKKIREQFGMTQAEFSKKLGIGQSTLAMMEVSKRDIADRHIKTICAICNINEHWLRTGEGEMCNLPVDDYTEAVVKIDRNDPKARQAILDYWSLPEEDKKLFWNFLDKFMKK